MPKSEQLLTTQQFAKKAGVSTATVSSWLRSGKIKGKKDGHKWLIAVQELKTLSDAKASPKPKKGSSQKTKSTASATKSKAALSSHSYSIEEFSEMTYLTVYGVEKWLREGRLVGVGDGSGKTRIQAANLENPLVKRLVR